MSFSRLDSLTCISLLALLIQQSVAGVIPQHLCMGCCAWCGTDGSGVPTISDDEEAPPPLSFSTFGGRWPQPGGLGSPITVTYSYNNFLDGGLKNLAGESVSADYIRTVTEEAFGLWASVAPIHFVEVPDIGTPVFTSNTSAYLAYDEDDFGQIRLNHRFINGTDAQNGRPTTKALAYAVSTFGFVGGDIHFDNGDPWEIIGTPSEPDILGIMTHEIGHSLGLGHSTIDGTVMFPAALRRMGPGTGTLLPDDINGIQFLYGAGVGSVTPLIAVPEPSSLVMLGILAGLASCRRRR